MTTLEQIKKAYADLSPEDKKSLKADEERKEDVHEERQDERTDSHDERLGAVEKQLADLTALVVELSKKPKEADKGDADELDKITKKWNQ